MKCIHCEKTTEAKRMPPGWHRDAAENPLCGACWNARYILRAVTIPVAGPADGEWPELREALKIVMRATTRLSNWAVTALAKADIVRMPEMEKLPKPPKVYLYPEARRHAPELDSGSVVAILHAVEGRWRKSRFDVAWLAKASLPNYRYPCPYPVRSQDWSALALGADGVPAVSVRIHGRRWTLRLRGGHEFHRPLAAFAKLLGGQAIAAELALIQQRTGGSHGGHRPSGSARDAGGAKFATRLMCKMCLWLPREAARETTGTLFLTRADDALIVAVNAKNDRLWTIHGDQVRRWMAEHRQKLQHWSDDQKREQRPLASFTSRREAASLKYRRRMDSSAHEFAAQVVGYARRFRFAAIRWVETAGAFAPQFPWHDFLGKVAQKADAAGIAFEKVKETESDDDEAETE